MTNKHELWPDIPYRDWEDTCRTLQLWTQVVGKVSLALAPFLNEFWHVALQVTPRGLTTGTLPYQGRAFEIRFDFVAQRLILEQSDRPGAKSLLIGPRSVAAFYAEFMDLLTAEGIDLEISNLPSEVPNPVSFDQDHANASCDTDSVGRWWQAMLSSYLVMHQFRGRFVGKSSPVQFYWGSFDLSYVRYSGRPAPLLTGVPAFMRIAEDQQNYACGFWPGNPNANGVELGEPAYYAYSYPEPPGFRQAQIQPTAARFDEALGEFILPYEAVRTAPDPASYLTAFLQTTYEAAANLGDWDRATLESAERR